MQLINVVIHNFRGLLHQEFSFQDYTLLVGPNNAGKSSVIDAIRAFYEKEGYKFRRETDFPFLATDQESWIELCFGLDDSEHASLADAYKHENKRLTVRKYFQTNAKTHDGKSCAGWIFAYKFDGNLSDEPFYGAKNVQSGKFGDLIYIPAISKVDEHAKLSGPSALRDLLSDIMTDVVGSGDAYKVLSESVQRFSGAIRQEVTQDGHSLGAFENDLSSMLRPWDAEFGLKFPAPSAAEIIKSMLSWQLTDLSHGKGQPIDNFGSGFQRHFIYSLVQLGAKYVPKKAVKKSKDFAPSLTLMLFEEPEAFLHPPQQDVLARSLMRISQTNTWQVLCATHSPQFVSKNSDKIPAIIRIRRAMGEVKAHQITDDDWRSIADSNQVINSIAANYPKMARCLHADDAKPEMEAVKHFLWLNPDRSILFFANHVLLVEGQSEVAFINRLIGEGTISSSHEGVYILDCLGKYNFHRFMNLLSRFGISHSVIHDDDDGRDEHEEINRLIEASRGALCTKIVQIPKNLEALLQLKQPGADHRKPQHLLYQYQTGQINSDLVKEFCRLLEAALG